MNYHATDYTVDHSLLVSNMFHGLGQLLAITSFPYFFTTQFLSMCWPNVTFAFDSFSAIYRNTQNKLRKVSCMCRQGSSVWFGSVLYPMLWFMLWFTFFTADKNEASYIGCAAYNSTVRAVNYSILCSTHPFPPHLCDPSNFSPYPIPLSPFPVFFHLYPFLWLYISPLWSSSLVFVHSFFPLTPPKMCEFVD